MLLGSWSYYQRLSAVQRLIINTRNIITRSSTSTHHNGGKWCSNLPPGGQQRNKFSVSQTAITRDRYGKSGNTGQESLRPKVKRIAGLLLTGGAVAVCIYVFHCNGCDVKASQDLFNADEVESHQTESRRIWVCYQGDVYDITDFVKQHPGGDMIKYAFGSSLDPFFKVYTKHNPDDIKGILEEMKVGRILPEEEQKLVVKSQTIVNSMDYHHEVSDYDKRLRLISRRPFEVETPGPFLATSFFTPNRLFYVRSHFAVPYIDLDNYNIAIHGEDKLLGSLTLEDVKSKFKKHEVSAVLQCTGNRRTNMGQFKHFKAVSIGPGYMGNALWGGALLSDVLRSLGVTQLNSNGLHVQFRGLDQNLGSKQHYEVSIPLSMVLQDKSQILLAYEMNGEELPVNHGYPLRLLVPGVTGSKSVKWLSDIIISKQESQSFWQQKDYKRPTYSVNTPNYDDISKGTSIYKMPVNSAICVPTEGDCIDSQQEVVEIAGYAYSGGGNAIVSVEVSLDGGDTWYRVPIEPPDPNTMYQTYTWTLWQVSLPIPEKCRNSGEMEILCRAADASHNVQPETVKGIWNPRGFLNNSWHRVKVNVK